MRTVFILFAMLMLADSRGQDFIVSSDADALYPTLDDFLQHHPDTSCQLRKVEDVRVDSLIHRCWFTDRDKGMIKDAFAVIYDRQLYLQDHIVRRQLPDTFHPHARKESNCFYPALEQGRYIVFEILSEDKNPDLSIAMGMMGGVVGSAFGNTLTPPDMYRSYVLLDTYTKNFYGWDTWKDIEFFLKDHYPAYVLPYTSGYPCPEDVRKLIGQLNKH